MIETYSEKERRRQRRERTSLRERRREISLEEERKKKCLRYQTERTSFACSESGVGGGVVG